MLSSLTFQILLCHYWHSLRSVLAYYVIVFSCSVSFNFYILCTVVIFITAVYVHYSHWIWSEHIHVHTCWYRMLLAVGRENHCLFIAFKTVISRYKTPADFCTSFSTISVLDQWHVLEPARNSFWGQGFRFKCACIRHLHNDLMKAEPPSNLLCFLSWRWLCEMSSILVS